LHAADIDAAPSIGAMLTHKLDRFFLGFQVIAACSVMNGHGQVDT